MSNTQMDIVFVLSLLTVVLFGLSFVISIPGVVIMAPIFIQGVLSIGGWWLLVIAHGGIAGANEALKEARKK